MSDSDVEIISGSSRPHRSRASRARPVAHNGQLLPREDELFQVELAPSSPPPPRRQPQLILDDEDDDDDEPSLFVSQNSSPAPDGDPRGASRSLPGVDVIGRGQSMMELRRQEFHRRLQSQVRRQHQHPPEDFIDLTEEPDSPEFPRLVLPPMNLPRNDQPRNAGFLDQIPNFGVNRAQNARAASGNPRRQAGLTRTPSLARSDASINGGRGRAGAGGNIPLIDLTEDGPEPAPAPAPRPPPAEADAAANNPWNWFPRHGQRRDAQRRDAPGPIARALDDQYQQLRGQISQLNHWTAAMFNNGNRPPAPAAAAAAEPPADQPDIPEIIGIIRLDYGGPIPADFWDPHHRPDPPKPSYVPPKEPMEGCSRSTGEDVVAICPSCEEELVYDPDEKPATPPPAKRQRTKKDRAEHHFMAVKACGHVFCRNCYEDRKQKAKEARDNKPSDHGGGFRQGPGKSTSIVCAVEGCESEVGSKAAWLGIFV